MPVGDGKAPRKEMAEQMDLQEGNGKRLQADGSNPDSPVRKEARMAEGSVEGAGGEDPEDMMLQIVMMENRVRAAQAAKKVRTRTAQSPE